MLEGGSTSKSFKVPAHIIEKKHSKEALKSFSSFLSICTSCSWPKPGVTDSLMTLLNSFHFRLQAFCGHRNKG